jgi:hypothetical protein
MAMIGRVGADGVELVQESNAKALARALPARARALGLTGRKLLSMGRTSPENLNRFKDFGFPPP